LTCVWQFVQEHKDAHHLPMHPFTMTHKFINHHINHLLTLSPCKNFFFWESFNLWRLLLIIALYYQIKTPISFWCRQGLNFRFLIQLSETLPVELTGTHCHHAITSNGQIPYKLLVQMHNNKITHTGFLLHSY